MNMFYIQILVLIPARLKLYIGYACSFWKGNAHGKEK